MTERSFIKMHGLGNDFAIFDARAGLPPLDGAAAALIGDRRRGVGCDQIIVMEPAPNADAAFFMRIFNPDGSEAGACGNATRCVARLYAEETGETSFHVETLFGLLAATVHTDMSVTIDMGLPQRGWQQIPLAAEADTSALPLARSVDGLADLAAPVAVSMGNPHAVFFVDDADAYPLEQIGPGLEHDPIFPQRANIELVSKNTDGSLRLRVWERGAGITQACGSGACATMVAAHERGLTGRKADLHLDGGTLSLEVREDGHVLMTGPASHSFRGAVDFEQLK